MKIPTPPPFKNHGNEVVSVAALARYQQRLAEEAGAYILTETAATQLIVEDGAVVGVRSGDKGRGKDGEPLRNFEPGTDVKAQVRRCSPRAAGAISPAPRSASSTSPTGASRRSGSSASRRSGRSPSRWTGSSTRSARGR